MPERVDTHVKPQAAEASFDYKRLPPARTVPMCTRFFVRGRGKPKPYPIEDR